MKPLHTILFPSNSEDKEKHPQAAVANSQGDFGATLVVIRDAGVSSALVFWDNHWRHLSMPSRFQGDGFPPMTWLVSQDVE